MRDFHERAPHLDRDRLLKTNRNTPSPGTLEAMLREPDKTPPGHHVDEPGDQDRTHRRDRIASP